MDPAKASQAVLARAKLGAHLVSFFGDASYGWFGPELLESLEQSFAQRAAQKASNRVATASHVGC